jgi:predicted nucleic acid-binding protein
VNFVLDASVTMCWFFLDGKPAERTYALSVLEAMKQSETSALVPVTWGLEISNVIGKAEMKGLITEAQSEAFLEMLGSIDVSVDTATFSKALSDTLQISRRHRLSAYDASYLELAMREGLPLATLDEDLQKAANKAGLKRFAAK